MSASKALRNLDGDDDVPAPGGDFPALEEKVHRAIEQLKAARAAKSSAERSAARLREQLTQRTGELESLRAEVVALRKEREEVRGRVEKLVKQIDQMVAED
jgi:chromosome segregation ATPase